MPVRPYIYHNRPLRESLIQFRTEYNHCLQFVEACRGNGETSASFAYSGPLTESVLLGCLATRFPDTTLEWDADKLNVTNVREANRFVRRKYREGWAVEGL